MIRRASIFVATAVVALSAACGKSVRREVSNPTGGRRGTTAGAGASSAGQQNEAAGASEGGSGGENGDGAQAGATAQSRGTGGGTSSGSGGVAFAGRTGATNGGATNASAGTTSGGAPSAGAANMSAAGAPAIAVPDGCVPAEQHVDGLFCSSDVTCDGDHVIVSCNPSTTDAGSPWSCSCTRGGATTRFDFAAATGTPTCVVASDACVHPELVTGAQDNCVLSAPGSANSCTALESCKQAYEVDGLALTMSSSWSGRCTAYGDRTGCWCGDSISEDYLLQMDDLSAGCDFLKPLCLGNAPVAGAWSCATDFDEAGTVGTGACTTRTSCTRSLTLDDGTMLTEATDFDAECQGSADGTSAECDCNGDAIPNQLTLLSDLPASDIGVCHLTAAACADAPPVVLTGSPSCTASKVQTGVNYCQKTLECSQAATAGSSAVTVLTTTVVACNQQPDGSWLCTCPLGVTLTSQATDPSLVCTQAAAQCPQVPAILP